MDEQVLLFFDKVPDALPLYAELERRILAEYPDTRIKVQKTQISFYNRHLFACVSFAKVRKKADRPDSYIVVTFGLEHRVDSPRIDIATEPYPNRWTHHVLISDLSEIDDELMGWIREAAEFSDRK
ncbi:MAG TPA: hypothetical protein H9817_07045 [Candidatus Mediterraneibacter stercorigallinarum]|uniref:DUF5655 domain-containing protein n=1 Tax=Candidatus Mediterraneibacter stercorigallinarum TaxID=2838686 RepID=A0A9D2IJR1_9FIRM|nr:hypothetical protein [Candidatus Mediterraneibacter vanvlietii]HIZ13663.1 hypothetical protein [Candidatus Mediterraneibacter stercorigallinarum]